MGLIKKIDNNEEFKSKMTQAQLDKMAYLERELGPSEDPVLLGKD